MRVLSINDSVQVQGGLTTSQAKNMIKTSVLLIGSKAVQFGLKSAGVPIDGSIEVGMKLLLMFFGYELSNRVMSFFDS